MNVPRHRNQPFYTLIFDNDSRSEAALVTTMAEIVVSGVSTRKVARVVETLCGTSISKSAVSDVCKDLDQEVEAFRTTGIMPVLSGMVFCADCGNKLYQARGRTLRRVSRWPVYPAGRKERKPVLSIRYAIPLTFLPS